MALFRLKGLTAALCEVAKENQKISLSGLALSIIRSFSKQGVFFFQFSRVRSQTLADGSADFRRCLRLEEKPGQSEDKPFKFSVLPIQSFYKKNDS